MTPETDDKSNIVIENNGKSNKVTKPNAENDIAARTSQKNDTSSKRNQTIGAEMIFSIPLFILGSLYIGRAFYNGTFFDLSDAYFIFLTFLATIGLIDAAVFKEKFIRRIFSMDEKKDNKQEKELNPLQLQVEH